MIYVSLTQTQPDERTSLSPQAIGRVAWHAQMVLLSDRGFTVLQIAAIHAGGRMSSVPGCSALSRKEWPGWKTSPAIGVRPKSRWLAALLAKTLYAWVLRIEEKADACSPKRVEYTTRCASAQPLQRWYL